MMAERDPDRAVALGKRGNELMQAGKAREAARCYSQAALLDPDNPEHHNNVGVALLSLRKIEDAAALFERAWEQRPATAEVGQNFAIALAMLGRLEEAEAVVKKTWTLSGPSAGLCHVLGTIYLRQGRLDDAIDRLLTAVDARPDFRDAHVALGMALMLQGNWERGFAEYEWREVPEPAAIDPDTMDTESPQIPDRWDGGRLDSKTILLQGEQGFGDTLMFARFARLVKENTGAKHVFLACHPALHALLRRTPGVDAVVARREIVAAHAWCPLLSTARLLGKIPQRPYLFADANTVPTHAWDPQILQIGYSWEGSPAHPDDRWRSIPLTDFAACFDGVTFPEADFVSLQLYKAGDDQREPRSSFKSFDHTASVIAGLDLVITVDSAVAHLAAGMGKPTWVLLQRASDWRWGLEETSPWYPTARLFRQETLGDWGPVFVRVREALRAEIEKRKDGGPAHRACDG